ncbi:MAG: nucleotidyl transferase AbiEii/AbiGii toxin family protein [Actinomycetaceae bacterium]|nr:nucleotidyl transferase AbiEii/AbiGii toxin family protein [Actinomycetaceae bacterium]
MNNIAESVRARLLNYSKKKEELFQDVLTRFALERLLYKISVSPYADRFLLKGSLLFAVWYGMMHRPTRDADLLGFGTNDKKVVGEIFKEIAAIHVLDGIEFDADSVRTSDIRKEEKYLGVRVIVSGTLAKARCKVQVDIGFGDKVTLEPSVSEYPVLLKELPAPRLRIYPVYTAISEKIHAIVQHGIPNGRMKDYYDLSVLLARETLDMHTLAQAIKATFDRSGHPLPQGIPIGLSDKFSADEGQLAMWSAFLRKNRLQSEPLFNVVKVLRESLMPAISLASRL